MTEPLNEEMRLALVAAVRDFFETAHATPETPPAAISELQIQGAEDGRVVPPFLGRPRGDQGRRP